MRVSFIWMAAVIGSASIYGCSCKVASPCAGLGDNRDAIVFLGTVVRDATDESASSRMAMLQVEEILNGLPPGTREIEIDTQADTSCSLPLKKGERWVILAGIQKDRTSPLVVGRCSRSFRLLPADVTLEAIRRTLAGGSPSIVGIAYSEWGRTQAPASGIRITARQGDLVRETQTGNDGQFAFIGIDAGVWHLKVESPGFMGSGHPRGAMVPERGCVREQIGVTAEKDLPDGRVQGHVRTRDDRPAAGVPVQIFSTYEWAKDYIDDPFQTAITDLEGRYEFTRLASRTYVLGINAEPGKDAIAYPKVFYPTVRELVAATVITLGDRDHQCCFDLLVDSPRQPAMLVVDVVLEDGTPRRDVEIRLFDLRGALQTEVTSRREDSEPHTIPVWMGESYDLQAHGFVLGGFNAPGYSLDGSMERIQILEPRTIVRVVLRRDPR